MGVAPIAGRVVKARDNARPAGMGQVVGQRIGALLTHPWVPEQTIREHTPPPF
jgi:hypothetical protein